MRLSVSFEVVFKNPKNAVFLLWFALILNSLAQAAELTFLSGDQVKSELKKFDRPRVVQGDFLQTKKIKDLDIRIDSSGNFRVSQVQADQVSVLWNVLKPEPMKVCLEQDQIQVNDLTTKKKTKLKLSEIGAEDGSGLQKLIHLMKLDPNDIVKSFDVHKISTQKFSFVPKSKKDFSFQQAEIELDTQKNPQKIQILETNGDSLEVLFLRSQEKSLDLKNTKSLSCLE